MVAITSTATGSRIQSGREEKYIHAAALHPPAMLNAVSHRAT